MEIRQVERYMAPEAVHCHPDTDLASAAHLLWTRDCGVLPVVDEASRVVGVVTDRDLLMCAYTTGRPLAELRVSECMATDVCTCAPADTLRSVLRTLGDARVRRLPVVDADGVLAGLLSINDVVHAVETTEEPSLRARLLEDLLAALAAIGVPRGPRRSASSDEVAPAPAAPKRKATAAAR